MHGDNSSKMEHNRYRNLVINNCYDGIVITSFSVDTVVEHISGENIGCFVHLSNCIGTVIKDYKATQMPSATIHVGSGTESHTFWTDDHYQLFHIDGCVDAIIENSNFTGEDLDFSQSKDCPSFMVASSVDNPLNVADYEDGLVENNCAIARVKFCNCIFSHKNNKYSDIRPVSKSYQGFYLVFDNCRFSAYRERFLSQAVYIFDGNAHTKSSYILKNCTAYYSVQGGNINELIGNGYMFFGKSGTLSIEGTYDITTSFDVPSGKQSQNVSTILA